MEIIRAIHQQQGAIPALLPSMMKASTTYELIAGFPHSSLPKVSGEPTFEGLKIIWRILNTNAVSVSSYE
jgi:hypothetical protein